MYSYPCGLKLLVVLKKIKNKKIENFFEDFYQILSSKWEFCSTNLLKNSKAKFNIPYLIFIYLIKLFKKNKNKNYKIIRLVSIFLIFCF
jgi:hypothetical protein